MLVGNLLVDQRLSVAVFVDYLCLLFMRAHVIHVQLFGVASP